MFWLPSGEELLNIVVHNKSANDVCITPDTTLVEVG